VTINREGERFCCEVGFEPIVTNARMNAPGNLAWAVWDRNYKELALSRNRIRPLAFIDGLDAAVEASVVSGEYVKADTLADLAHKLGVPADALIKTVERYNKWCDKVLTRISASRAVLCPVKDGPFYAGRISAWLLNIPHGLHVDHNSQVLTETDEPIDGLYAVGNVQGDFFANSYPVTVPGANHAAALPSGGWSAGRWLRIKKLQIYRERFYHEYRHHKRPGNRPA
jgi:hypothetical protein